MWYVLRYRMKELIREQLKVPLIVLAAAFLALPVISVLPDHIHFSGWDTPQPSVVSLDNVRTLNDAPVDPHTGGVYWLAYQGLYDNNGMPRTDQVHFNCGLLERALGFNLMHEGGYSAYYFDDLWNQTQDLFMTSCPRGSTYVPRWSPDSAPVGYADGDILFAVGDLMQIGVDESVRA
ncbi:MAG TPA: hypothetical protein VLF91_03590 [Candidatus Saccharimonadales bacterium]|nr:hypothetical protein [Candidatus Saccharimonadales bacterium]